MTTALLIGATFLLAGLVKGVIGMGLPTVAMGLLALVLPPAEAAAILVVPSLVTNVWQLTTGPRFGALARRLWPMMLAIVAGTIAGAGVLAGNVAGLAKIGLGAALLVYALVGLAGIRLSVGACRESWLGPVVGATTGLVTGATGVFVIPAVPYLQAIGLEKDELIQALGLSFTVSACCVSMPGRPTPSGPRCWRWCRRCWVCRRDNGCAAASPRRRSAGCSLPACFCSGRP